MRTGAWAARCARIALAACLGLSTLARADGLPPLPSDPVLTSLIEQSLASRPELAEARATVQAERERVPQASAFADPMLTVGWQNDGFTSIEIGKMEGSYVSIMASEAFPWPGKRALRGEIVELGARQGEQGIARLRLATEADVRRAWLDLLLARDRLGLLEKLDEIWARAGDVAKVRYETGEGSQNDVLRSRLERDRLAQRRLALQAQDRVLVRQLNRQRGHPLDEAIDTGSHLSDLAAPAIPDAAAALDDARSRSPELAAARLGVSQSEKAQELSGKGYFGDLTVGAGIMLRGGDFPPMWQVSLGAPLPIFAGSKQGRAVAETEARTVARRRGVEAVEQALALRIEERRVVLASLLDAARLYREQLLVRSEATSQAALAQYAVGKAAFASVLEANAGLVADQDAFLQTLVDAQRIAIAFHEVSLDPVSTAVSGAMGGAAMPGAGAMAGGGSKGAGAGSSAAAPADAAQGGGGAMPSGM